MGDRALSTRAGDIPLPAYLPDATYGFVRGVAAADLAACAVPAIVVNAFHVAQRLGAGAARALGGAHRMYGWTGPVMTDSGGFQAWSLLRSGRSAGTLSDAGMTVRADRGRPFQLGPDKSIALQLMLGADILFCLDDCTAPDDPPEVQETAVRRTILWARKCRQAFDRATADTAAARPLLFAAIQGGAAADLRRRCADALLEIGFDGYGFGGWPLDANGSLVADSLALVRTLVPGQFPLHALGVGKPESVLAVARMGYTTFDSALPTRDARDGRLYSWTVDPRRGRLAADGWRETIYIDDDKHIRNAGPISDFCECAACRTASVGFLRHLRKSGDALYTRLATIHNLTFVTTLMASIRDAG